MSEAPLGITMDTPAEIQRLAPGIQQQAVDSTAMPLGRAVGTARLIDGVSYIALPHPSGASRWLNDPAHRALLRRGLSLLRLAARRLDKAASGPTIRSHS